MWLRLAWRPRCRAALAAIAAPATLHFLEGRDHGTACAGRMTGHGLALRVELQTGAPLPLGGYPVAGDEARPRG